MPVTPLLTLEERRARREERRIKQRAQNTLRSAKMHLERIEAPSERVANFPKIYPGEARIHVGCSGWFYWHWKGLFYPAELPTSGWFKHYLKRFRTVELNAPFYGWPTVATVKSWLKQIERSNFIYTVKVNELITHIKRFKGTKTLIQDFGYIADLLGPHMGCFLFQLPPSYHFTRARLTAIVSQLDPTRRNVVEFRHASWWRDEVYAAFRAGNIIFCSCSAPRLPDLLVKTTDEIYVRFHGKERWYSHDYSKAELAAWAARIKDAAATQSWIYFNNDREGHAIKNAKALLRRLKLK